MTEDSGAEWRKSSIALDSEDEKFTYVEDTLEFHPDADYEDNVAVVSNKREVVLNVENECFEHLLMNHILKISA